MKEFAKLKCLIILSTLNKENGLSEKGTHFLPDIYNEGFVCSSKIQNSFNLGSRHMSNLATLEVIDIDRLILLNGHFITFIKLREKRN